MQTTCDWDWQELRRISEREVRRVLAGRDGVDDAVQEALARAWRGRRACRTPRTPQPWVAQIARHEALRHAVRVRTLTERTVALEDENEPIDPRLLEARLDVVDVRRAVRRLPAEDRALLALRYGEDRTQPAVALALGIPEGTVKVRLHRLRKRLRTVLEVPS